MILYYVKGDTAIWNQQYQAYDAQYLLKFKKIDPATGQHFQDVALTGPGVRTGPSGRPWRGHDPTAKGRHWQPASYLYTKYKQVTGDDLAQYPLLKRLDKLDEAGLIYWTDTGGLPRYKQFLVDAPGAPLHDVWTDIDAINSQAAERLGYPTQKPELLMERIISASSSPGDMVLDPFCGCGTTIAVAHRLKRQWIGIDITYQSIALVLSRLEDHFGSPAVADIGLDGVPRDMASAKALAAKKDDRLRKEFEKWAILTYTRNRAAINERKGADGGIDGYAYVFTSKTETDRVVFQVKSGHVSRGDVAKLKGDMDRESAKVGVLITLEKPTAPMRTEARRAGIYQHAFTGVNYNRVQIVTVREILEGNKRLDMPLSAEILKAAKAADDGSQQPAFQLQPTEHVMKTKMVKAALPLGFEGVKPRRASRRRKTG